MSNNEIAWYHFLMKIPAECSWWSGDVEGEEGGSDTAHYLIETEDCGGIFWLRPAMSQLTLFMLNKH